MKNIEDKKNLSKEQIDSVVSLYSSGKFNDAIDAINLLNVEYPNVPLLYNILGVTEALCSKQNKDISSIYLNLFRILNDETRKTRMFTSDLSNI